MIDITGLREDKRQQSSAIVHALIDRLEAAEKSRDDLLACLGEWLDKTKWVQQGSNEGTISAKYIGLHRADVMARLLDEAEKERDALRAKLAEMEKQEPLDAGSDVFRSAFEAALKAGNWPATRQGDGYRSPSTQIAWRIAFSTVNRLKLYISPGAQSGASMPEVTDAMALAFHHALTDGSIGAREVEEIKDALRVALAAAPEAKP